MSKYQRNFIFIAISAGLASSLSLIGGIGLEAISDKLLPLVPLIIVLPGLNDLVGDYASIIAAHTGDPSEHNTSKTKLAKSIYKVLAINISALIIFSLIIAHSRGYLISATFLGKFVIFIMLASGLSVLFMFVMSHLLERLLKREKINPDELLIPIVTSVADVFMLLMVTVAVLTIF